MKSQHVEPNRKKGSKIFELQIKIRLGIEIQLIFIIFIMKIVLYYNYNYKNCRIKWETNWFNWIKYLALQKKIFYNNFALACFKSGSRDIRQTMNYKMLNTLLFFIRRREIRERTVHLITFCESSDKLYVRWSFQYLVETMKCLSIFYILQST